MYDKKSIFKIIFQAVKIKYLEALNFQTKGAGGQTLMH